MSLPDIPIPVHNPTFTDYIIEACTTLLLSIGVQFASALVVACVVWIAEGVYHIGYELYAGHIVLVPAVSPETPWSRHMNYPNITIKILYNPPVEEVQKIADAVKSPIEVFALNVYYILDLYIMKIFVIDAALFLVFLTIPLIGMWISLTSNVIHTYSQRIFEQCYNFLLILFKTQVKSVRALSFFSVLFTLFLVIFFLNFSSLFTYNITLTGHIVITLFFAFSLFFGFLTIGILNFQNDFLFFFIPQDVPLVLKILLTIIEIVSFFIRPFSLSIRLFANMLAGHTLLHIFGSFYLYILHNYAIILILPIIICVAISVLEIGVAIIQAYVFFTLLTIYLNDMYFISH